MRGTTTKLGENAWKIRWESAQDPGTGQRRQRAEVFRGTRKEAEKRLRELVTLADRGIAATDTLTVGAWLDKYLKESIAPRFRAKTVERYEGLVRLHLRPLIGAVPLNKLAPGHIKELHRALADKGMSASALQLCHGIVSGAMKKALAMELVWRNACAGITPPSRSRKELQIPDLASVSRVLEMARAEGDPLWPALVLDVHTGMRRGEVLGLSWGDVDFRASTVSIRQAVVRTKSGVVLQGTKTERSRRKLDIDGETMGILRAHRARQAEHRLAAKGYRNDLDLVFADDRGEPTNPMKLTRLWQRLCQRAGLGVVKLHAARHAHASALLMAGEDLFKVSRRLGHSSIGITADVYGHLADGAQHDMAERFAALMRGASQRLP